MPEPTIPAVEPSPEPTTPVTEPEGGSAAPAVEPTTPAAPVTPEPTTPAEPVTPTSSQAPPVTPPVTPQPGSPAVGGVPPEGDPTPVSDPAAAPPEGGPRVVPKADEYKLPEGAPTQLGEFAHANNMTQEQLDATVNTFGGYISNTRKMEKLNLRAAGEQKLKDWGDNSKYNLTLAKRALKQNDPEGKMTKALNDSGYGNHPAVLDFLFTIGQSMKEGGFLKSAVNRPPGQKTMAQTMYPDLPSKEA